MCANRCIVELLNVVSGRVTCNVRAKLAHFLVMGSNRLRALQRRSVSRASRPQLFFRGLSPVPH